MEFIEGATKVMSGFNNAIVLNKLKEGDLVEFPRDFLYSHWGVYVGDEMIVHLSGEGNDGVNGVSGPEHMFSVSGVLYSKARVCKERFLDVAGDSAAKINNNHDNEWRRLSPREIVQRALSSIGEIGYNIFTMNCEHFANWCRYNKVKSDQVDDVVTGATVAGTIGMAAGIILWAALSGNKEETEEEKRRKERQKYRSLQYR